MAEEFAGRRIVAVEDEPHVLDLIRTTLESAGFVVSGAATGLEGISRIRDELPDIALLDVNLPDMSGFDVLENVRKTLGIPCIMLTVQDDEDARVRGLELGADDYIGKPFGHRELVSRIKAVLRRAEAPAPLARNRVRIDDRLMVDFDRRLAIVDGEAVHLVIVTGEKLVVANSYPAPDIATADYFLFEGMKRFRIDPQMTAVWLCKPLSKEMADSLKPYCREVRTL